MPLCSDKPLSVFYSPFAFRHSSAPNKVRFQSIFPLTISYPRGSFYILIRYRYRPCYSMIFLYSYIECIHSLLPHNSVFANFLIWLFQRFSSYNSVPEYRTIYSIPSPDRGLEKKKEWKKEEDDDKEEEESMPLPLWP